MKRMITSPPDHEDYRLTINSERHPAHGLAVAFRVKVSELNISLNELELGDHRDWEVGVESVSAPNNGEAFHTISEKIQSMGFFTLGFTTMGAGGRDYFYPTCHLPHQHYSVSTVLGDIREKMVDMFPTSHSTGKGVNVVGELFRACVFDPHIDSVSDFVVLKSVGSDQSIFSKMFVKLLSIYTPGDDCKLVRMNMWFSTELKDFLAKFTTPTAWAPVAPLPSRREARVRVGRSGF